MKKILYTIFAILFIAVNMKALEPVRIGLNYPNPSGSLKIKLIEVASNGATSEITTRTISDVSSNSSGVVSLVVGENDPDWQNRPESLSSNTSVLIRVFDENDNFIKQFVYRDLVSIQASTGNGGVLNDGFNSTGGITTSGDTADDFLFGAVAIPFTGGLGFNAEGDDTKFFFRNSLGAIRAGAVTSSVWNDPNVGEYSTGFGYNTTASGQAAFAAGNYTEASGLNSTALGDNTEASGEGSFTIGGYNIASGDFSTAIGVGLEAESFSEIVVGSYNTTASEVASTEYFDYDDRLFVIGNGFEGEGILRSDAMVVYKSGDTEINGDLTVSNYFAANGITYPDSEGGEEGQILTYDSEGNELVWSDAPTFVLNTNGTLTGDPSSEETPLGVDLTASNTWSGATTFSDDLSLTEASFTGNGNQALYTDDNGLVTAGSGETVQNAAGIYAGKHTWATGLSNTIINTNVTANSIITITFEGSTDFAFRISSVSAGEFELTVLDQIQPTGTIHYMIINQ